jgi:2-dehydro-3-deoxygluconokinase
MIRLTPPNNERIERTTSFNVTSGGAELNAAVTMACLDQPASWVSVLPDTVLGRSIVRNARGHNVDTSLVKLVPESAGRTGVYFLEEGTDPRPSSILYDRAGSAIALMKPGTFDWERIFSNASAFLVSGITPAVGPGARTETLTAIRAANAARIPVFFDPNYRSKLWTEEEARACFVEIAPLVDVMFASRSAMATFFGIDSEDHSEVLKAACVRLGLAACVFTRKRGKRSRSQRMAAIGALSNGEVVETEWKEVEIVDRVGGGDAFAGGFIVGYLEQPENLSHALELGLAASALKHTMIGDFLAATRSEIEAAIAVTEGGELQR